MPAGSLCWRKAASSRKAISPRSTPAAAPSRASLLRKILAMPPCGHKLPPIPPSVVGACLQAIQNVLILRCLDRLQAGSDHKTPSMKPSLLALVFCAFTSLAVAESKFPGLKAVLSAAEWERAGLDRLTPDQIGVIDAALIRREAG